MMSSKKVLITADSVCDLGPELQARLGVIYHPFHIGLDGRDYMDDGVDITPQKLFAICREKGCLPQSAAQSAGEYIEFFTPYLQQGFEIVHFCLASSLSSSYDNCAMACQQLEGVYPIDSHNLSSAIGLLIIKAHDLVEQGMDAAQVAARINELRCTSHASFILDTLDYMVAGGRCSATKALLVSALSIKPCIEVDNSDGHMGVAKKYRGKHEKVLATYVKDQLTSYDNIIPDHVFITHSGVDEAVVANLVQLVKDTLPAVKEVHVSTASCTISTHCGPKCLGVLFLTEPQD